jgi:hypothetical protein
MGIEEREKVQATGRGNIFNKIIAENLPNLQKEMAKKPLGLLKDMIKVEHLHCML